MPATQPVGGNIVVTLQDPDTYPYPDGFTLPITRDDNVASATFTVSATNATIAAVGEAPQTTRQIVSQYGSMIISLNKTKKQWVVIGERAGINDN